jgi:hypothetical protein
MKDFLKENKVEKVLQVMKNFLNENKAEKVLHGGYEEPFERK